MVTSDKYYCCCTGTVHCYYCKRAGRGPGVAAFNFEEHEKMILHKGPKYAPPTPPNLGITQEQIDKMQKRVSKLDQENQAIEPRDVRQAIDQRLVEIRLLLRDGNLKGLSK